MKPPFSLMRYLTLICLPILLIISCNTSKMLTSDVTARQIDTLFLFKPVTSISIIKTRNKQVYNDSLSSLASWHIIDKVSKYFPKSITFRTSDFDIGTQNQINQYILKIITYIPYCNNQISYIKIPPFLDSILQINHVNYGLCVVQSGFSRTSSNYSGQLVKGILIGLATPVAPIPIKAKSSITCLIIDRKKQNLAFYRSINQELEPADASVINQQIEQIFKKYFYPND